MATANPFNQTDERPSGDLLDDNKIQDKPLVKQIEEKIEPIKEELKKVNDKIEEILLPVTQDINKNIHETMDLLEEKLEPVKGRFDNMLHQAQRKIGMSYSTQPGNVPEPPHGIPPSDMCNSGIVADQDKTLIQQVMDSYSHFSDSVNKFIHPSQRKLGQSQYVTLGVIPEPPHGIPPSDGYHTGKVAEQDKRLFQQIQYKIEPVKVELKNINAKMGETVYVTIRLLDQKLEPVKGRFDNMLHQVQRKIGQSYSTQPGTVPEPPHGIPPSDMCHNGKVADQDKTLFQQFMESYPHFVGSVNQFIHQSQSKLGQLSYVKPYVRIPEPPHGIPPSDDFPSGRVADQDKSFIQQLNIKVDHVIQKLDKMAKASTDLRHKLDLF